MSPRAIYLLIYPQRRVPAHWSLFIPSPASADVGKVIHVIGSPFTGYTHQFKRNYNPARTLRPVRRILLGTITAQGYVTDVVAGDDKVVLDVEPRDRIEEMAREVKAPGVSEAPLELGKGRNCQGWLEDFVAKLVEDAGLEREAVEVLRDAPRM